jgi:hypothetical protein
LKRFGSVESAQYIELLGKNDELRIEAAVSLNDVEMVALKVATVDRQTGDTLHVDELRREAGAFRHTAASQRV